MSRNATGRRPFGISPVWYWVAMGVVLTLVALIPYVGPYVAVAILGGALWLYFKTPRQYALVAAGSEGGQPDTINFGELKLSLRGLGARSIASLDQEATELRTAADQSSFIPEGDEELVAAASVSVLKETFHTERRSSSTGGSMRVGRVRVGDRHYSSSNERVNDGWNAVDRGTLVVTSDRVVYIGQRSTISIRLQRLIGVENSDENVRLNVSSRQAPLVLATSSKKKALALVTLVNLLRKRSPETE